MLVEMTMEGTPVTLGRKASTEFGMHRFIYKERPDVRGVVHGHPTYATGFAMAHLAIPSAAFPEVIIGLGAVPLAAYATPSTAEVGDSLAPFVASADAVLMANHGVVAYGATVEEAYYKLEKVEHAAHTSFVARVLGGEHNLSEKDLTSLRALSGPVYGKVPHPTPQASPHAAESGQEFSEGEIRDLIRSVLAERTDRKHA
jgi:L-fuculose-phosphate aldolase